MSRRQGWRGGLRWRRGWRGGISRRRRGSGRWRGGLRWRRGRVFGDCGGMRGRRGGRRVGAGGDCEDGERERRDSVYGRAHGWDCSGNLRLASSERAAARRGLARARAFCRNRGLARNSQKPILGKRGADCRRISSAPFSLFSLKFALAKPRLRASPSPSLLPSREKGFVGFIALDFGDFREFPISRRILPQSPIL